ncbi:MAG: spermidine synthase family protein [Myxococcaceae bacterium]
MKSRLFCFGVALTSGASLALSLLFTRIFSVTMYYHFAFLLVSMALLGIAVSGVVVFLLPKVFRDERLARLAGGFAVLMAPLAVVALSVAVENPMSVDLQGDNVNRLIKLYIATALPFLASGFAISLAIAGAKQMIGKVYAYDLIGAALGCVLIVPLISAVGGQAAVVVAGAVAAAGGVLLALSSEKKTPFSQGVVALGAVAAVGLLFFATVSMQSAPFFKIAQGTKFLNESTVEFERWNSFSRVTVSAGEADHKWIHIDADAATRMYSGEIAKGGYEAPRRFSEARVAGVVYSLRNEGPALIIGPGGGPDLISALRAGVPKVTGVEVNPIIADTIMRGQYQGFNGDLYRNPKVQVVVDDGRSYVSRSEESYSSIQATLVDTWAASSAGAFTLSENNLYTVEAFGDYLSHLQPDGVVSMTRWYGAPPIEFLRLMGLGREALNRRGVAEAEHPRYFFVAADNRMATMLLKRQPYTQDEVAKLVAECNASGLRVMYSPFRNPGEDPNLVNYLGMASAEYYAKLPFDITPTSDNRPFFFYTVKGSDYASLLSRLGNMERNNLGLVILQVVLLISQALTLLLVVLPLLVFRRDVLREQRAGKLRTMGYFLCLGFGFILVELGLMQRFILFLGHPIYALAVVLATLLGASGVGSALSPRIEAKFGITGGVRRVVMVLSAVLILYMLGLGPVFTALLGLPITVRVMISAVLVAVLGVLMGTLLPLGVRAATGYGAEVVPWAWGLNGATSVVGSTLAVVLSMQFGFSVTLLSGVLAYALGTVVLGSAAKAAAPSTSATAGSAKAA